ncbi:hypothetical protein VCR15J2_390029 [Vibrio coralliirubri]|uniref:hypothetical protein n=1 Tax=Vibrio coralliirubri TaxID=1516159 RepID=UPI000635F302|nr:hypothetical protein [Vibrio coralliirubri]CDT52928.1 hypothetical protein VCR15J2_390029 [Vibrio coralliirubri]
MKTYVAIGDTDNPKFHKLAKLFAARMRDKGFTLITCHRELEDSLMIGAKGHGYRFSDKDLDFPGVITKFTEFDRIKMRSLDPAIIMKPIAEQKLAAMAYQMLLGLDYSGNRAKFLILFNGDRVTETTIRIANKQGIKIVDVSKKSGLEFVMKVIKS